jgi:hypothetical protein
MAVLGVTSLFIYDRVWRDGGRESNKSLFIYDRVWRDGGRESNKSLFIYDTVWRDGGRESNKFGDYTKKIYFTEKNLFLLAEEL